MSGPGLAFSALRAVRFLRLQGQISRPAAALLSDLLLVGRPGPDAQRIDGRAAPASWATDPIPLERVAGGYSHRHARRSLRVLEDLGLLVVTRHPWGASAYRVRIGRLFALARTQTQRLAAVRLASAAEA